MSEKGGSSKVRAFIGQTPKNLKEKFFSVLGTSSEYKKQLISGISHKVRDENSRIYLELHKKIIFSSHFQNQ